MNCVSDQVVLYRGHGYSNSSIPCRGVLLHTCFHHLASAHDMCSADFKRKPTWVWTTSYLNTQVSSPGLSPIRVPSAGSPAEVSTNDPERCEQGSRDTKRANWYIMPRAYRNTAHPDGQRCVRPPAYYKHQKLLATPGQRTRVDKKSSGVISQGPMCGSN